MARSSLLRGFLSRDTSSTIALPKAAIRENKNISPDTFTPEDKITSPNKSPASFCLTLNFSKS